MYHNWLFLLMGIFPLLVGIYVLHKEVTLRKGGVRTTGVIVGVKRENSTDSDGFSEATFRPIVQFVTHDGQEIVWQSTTSGTGWWNSLGKQMQIIYDPRNPQRVIRNHWSNYFWIMVLFFLSAVCIVPVFVGK